MEIFHNLKQDALILTPNRRLTVSLKKSYAEYKQSQGYQCWPSLDILPLNSWFERLWQEYTVNTFDVYPRLLTSEQELILWEEIVTNDPENSHLLQVRQTAELAQSAWGLLKQYKVEKHHTKLDTTEDSRVFLRWATQFENKCKENHWLDSPSLVNMIQNQLLLKTITLPSQIILFGFTEPSKQLKDFFNACHELGSEISESNTHIQNHSTHRLALPEIESEMMAMALHAKNYLAAHPDANMACVVPNLEDKRDMILRIFSEVFTPPGYVVKNYLDCPFNISAGKNLASYPIIQAAFRLLELYKKKISIEHFHELLRSPFFAAAESEMLPRAYLQQRIQEENLSEIILEKVLSDDHLDIKSFCPILWEKLSLFCNQTKTFNNHHPCHQWITFFTDMLKLFGWPGERSTNSEEYQAIERWLKVLNQFKSFDPLLKPISYTQALSTLYRLTQNIVFQPESPETPIQILGMLEAAEVPFDHIWIMGMDDTAWPESPKPNPFIPHSLQKALNMPHASPERELLFCEAMTQQFQKSGKEIIFSHSLQNDVSELRASALIENFSELPAFDLQTHSVKKHIFQHRELENFKDEKGPPIPSQEIISGGVKIFELQAACPFKAFSELRLFAKMQDDFSLGLRAKDKGNIIHYILEKFWQDVKNSTTLLQLSEKEIQDKVKQLIQKSLKKFAKSHFNQKEYLLLETIRLEKIILSWIEIEKSRPSFDVISQEETLVAPIANFNIKLRIDRIDEVIGFGKLIIDYKTGKNITIKHCFGDRPESLQLPLYCVIHPENIIGMAFAKIHSENLELEGISQRSLDFPSIKILSQVKWSHTQQWSEQINHWQQQLENLGQAFSDGHAEVNPKEIEKTCQYCHLKSFCRINENHYE